jgi:L-serine dehydratase
VAGLLGWPMTDQRFEQAIELAPAQGLTVKFAVDRLPAAEHPNTVCISVRGKMGTTLRLLGRSVGGGAVEVTELEDWAVLLNGANHVVIIECEAEARSGVSARLLASGGALTDIATQRQGERALLTRAFASEIPAAELADLRGMQGVRRTWCAAPLSYVKRRPALCDSAKALLELSDREGCTLGCAAMKCESHLLGIAEVDVLKEMIRRFDIMREAVREGLGESRGRMQLLRPTAKLIYEAEARGRLAIGGLHSRAAARAMAAMHVNCGRGVVCAAPTAGSAGVLPGVLATLAEERGLSREQAGMCLLAAGAVGVVVAERATFAAEVAGCQVEIGAAGAMAAAAVVEFAGGTARQAMDAAAISFQNTMGMVCDLVQGIVEIPCHTRNAVAASSAFVCADLAMGGYQNPIPLDETIDAVYAVGKMMPRELRVTSLGGLAVTPSALAMKRLR